MYDAVQLGPVSYSRKVAKLGLVCLLVIAAACTQVESPPGVTPSPTPAPKFSGVSLPEHFLTGFVHYATVERIDGTIRDLYVDPDVVEAAKSGRLLPDGTIIVIEGYYAVTDPNDKSVRDETGRLVKGEPFEMIHVVEKRSNWTDSDFVSAARAGRWNFGSYDFTTHDHFDEDITACFNCHNATPATDFIYTQSALLRFARTGEVQYIVCNLTGRIAC